MKSRQILIAILMVGTLWHSAVAQPKEKKTQAAARPSESILGGTSMHSNPVLLNLIAVKPEMPLGPQDVLKSYEIAMGMVAEKTSSDFATIVQAQQANQITRKEAEYLLAQRYEMALMQYQALSALHDVLQHDIDEANQKSRASLKTAKSDTVVVVPFPDPSSGSR